MIERRIIEGENAVIEEKECKDCSREIGTVGRGQAKYGRVGGGRQDWRRYWFTKRLCLGLRATKAMGKGRAASISKLGHNHYLACQVVT